MIEAKNGERVFVTNYIDNTVLAIDTATNTVIDTFHVPVQQPDPEFYASPNGVNNVAVNSDGSRLYVAATDGYIRAIDTASDTVVGTVGAGSDMTVSADGHLLYVANGARAVEVYDTETMARVGEIPVGLYQFDSSAPNRHKR